MQTNLPLLLLPSFYVHCATSSLLEQMWIIQVEDREKPE